MFGGNVWFCFQLRWFLVCKLSQCLRHSLENNIATIFRFFHILWDLQKLSFEKEGTVVLAEWSWALLVYNSQEFWIKSEKNCRLCLRNMQLVILYPFSVDFFKKNHQNILRFPPQCYNLIFIILDFWKFWSTVDKYNKMMRKTWPVHTFWPWHYGRNVAILSKNYKQFLPSKSVKILLKHVEFITHTLKVSWSQNKIIQQ